MQLNKKMCLVSAAMLALAALACQPAALFVAQATVVPTRTPRPTFTPIPSATNTLVPTQTATPAPTATATKKPTLRPTTRPPTRNPAARCTASAYCIAVRIPRQSTIGLRTFGADLSQGDRLS